MYRREEFRRHYIDVGGGSAKGASSYIWTLGRIDAALNGLDESLEAKGHEAVLDWSRTTSEPPFDTYPRSSRSALKRYLKFVSEPLIEVAREDSEDILDELDPVPNISSYFQLEREMQLAVRLQLARIEEGLHEVDGGSEANTATGRVDILARDKSGQLVAIELKAGHCPRGALEQTLGYAQSLSDEYSEPVRAILIAFSFPDRIRAAAKRSVDLTILEYKFQLSFSEA